jgi:hypothetical protein
MDNTSLQVAVRQPTVDVLALALEATTATARTPMFAAVAPVANM